MSARTVLSAIRVIHRESRETYGSPSLWDALLKQGHCVGEHRVARLMRQAGLRAKTVKKWRATTQSQHRFPVTTNTLNRQFTVAQPNRVWAGDLTYVWTTEGWLYLAVILDLYSRRVIGWAMGHRLTVELAEQALTRALANRTPRAGLLHHSTMPVSKAFSVHSRASSCTIGTTRPVKTRARTSSNISRCSIIGSAGTRPLAITPRPSTKRGRRWLNPVSTELGEGHPAL